MSRVLAPLSDVTSLIIYQHRKLLAGVKKKRPKKSPNTKNHKMTTITRRTDQKPIKSHPPTQ